MIFKCIFNFKKRKVDVALFHGRFQVGQCIMGCIKLEFNDIISLYYLYKKNDSERRRFVSLDILYCYYLL